MSAEIQAGFQNFSLHNFSFFWYFSELKTLFEVAYFELQFFWFFDVYWAILTCFKQAHVQEKASRISISSARLEEKGQEVNLRHSKLSHTPTTTRGLTCIADNAPFKFGRSTLFQFSLWIIFSVARLIGTLFTLIVLAKFVFCWDIFSFDVHVFMNGCVMKMHIY